MQNLQPLVTADNVHEGCYTLLRSPVIRNSYESKGVVFDLVEKYACLPRIIFDYTNYGIERSQFNSYYGTLSRRDYGDARAISDLYYMHEMAHANIAGYQHNQREALWAARIQKEEAYASVMTELVIYFEMPDLRSHVQFPGGDIWADRFLKDEVKIHAGSEDRMIARNPTLKRNCSNSDLFREDKELFIWLAITERERIMNATNPGLLDEQQRIIHGYARTNTAWADIWRGTRSRVENAMLTLQATSQIDRKVALDNHIAWLQREQGSGVCPFETEAIAFKRVLDELYSGHNLKPIDKRA